MAATHGVYSRQKTNRLAADREVILDTSVLVFPKRIDSVETTLSFAKNPVIRALTVVILQCVVAWIAAYIVYLIGGFFF